VGESIRTVLPLLLPWIAAALLLVLVLPSLTYALLLRLLPTVLPGRPSRSWSAAATCARGFPRLISP
jgi:hypothetical protein